MDFIKVKDVSEMTSLSPSAIYSLAKQGRIPHYKMASSLRFVKSEVTAWLADAKNGFSKKSAAV